jgi:hypothetical protein
MTYSSTHPRAVLATGLDKALDDTSIDLQSTDNCGYQGSYVSAADIMIL